MAPVMIKLALGLLALFFFLRWFERRQVYQPSQDTLTEDPVPGHPPENLFLTTTDGIKVHAWFFPSAKESSRSNQVIFLLHGNAGNLSQRGEVFGSLLQLGANIFAIDYRGYGKSEGSPSEEGTYRDADAGYDWLVKRGFASRQIIALGQSLGGGVASYLAANKPIGGLILQSTYTSLPDVGSELFPFLPVRLVGKIKYPTRSRLADLKIPVLTLHSRIDEIIPYHHGERNFEAAKDPKLFWELRAGHNDYLVNDGPNFLAGLRAYLDRFFPR